MPIAIQVISFVLAFAGLLLNVILLPKDRGIGGESLKDAAAMKRSLPGSALNHEREIPKRSRLRQLFRVGANLNRLASSDLLDAIEASTKCAENRNAFCISPAPAAKAYGIDGGGNATCIDYVDQENRIFNATADSENHCSTTIVNDGIEHAEPGAGKRYAESYPLNPIGHSSFPSTETGIVKHCVPK
jgi:hypothetical protein